MKESGEKKRDKESDTEDVVCQKIKKKERIRNGKKKNNSKKEKKVHYHSRIMSRSLEFNCLDASRALDL